MSRLYHVWSENALGGHEAAERAGYDDGHSLGLYHGEATADSFAEACAEVFRTLGPVRAAAFDSSCNTFWGCALFEREPYG